ncbi:hypothetical protein Tco_0913680 [Tanacetum coccineum]
MRLAKKVRGTVEASESFRGKLERTMEEEASCCRTSCIYRGEEDQSFSIRSSLESKMACTKRGMSQCRLARTLVDIFVIRKSERSTLKKNEEPAYVCHLVPKDVLRYRRLNRGSKRLYRVLVAEFIDGEQFVTEEIIEEENCWPNIEVRTTWDRKIIRAASLNGGTITVYED